MMFTKLLSGSGTTWINSVLDTEAIIAGTVTFKWAKFMGLGLFFPEITGKD